MLAPWPCPSVDAVEWDQTIFNVIRELIAANFRTKPMTAGALAIIFLATVAGFLAIIAVRLVSGLDW
jgi:hypothetical protein